MNDIGFDMLVELAEVTEVDYTEPMPTAATETEVPDDGTLTLETPEKESTDVPDDDKMPIDQTVSVVEEGDDSTAAEGAAAKEEKEM